MPRRLIVTADDFGLDPQVNEAVERAHRQGILTSASLMVAAPAAADAVARARRLSGLRVGLHLAVVDAPPALAPEIIPRLMGGEGRLRAQSARTGAAFFLRPAVRRELAREIRAQFEAFAATGLALDHVNGHRHMHLHPTVGRLMLEIGREFDLRAVRVPDERLEVLARAAPGVRPGIEARVMRPWVGLLRRRLRRAGLLGNDQAFGIHWSGAMDEERVLGLLPHLPEGITEMYFHPRLAPVPGTDAGPADLAALESGAVRARVRALGIELTAFGALV
ncbi:MAG: hopanoid biosynthesis-associated protein HpnK [Gammaproteobacteria bacterium]|nr:hopanoid biosynthesis-associated protein HpnK [Gammaproteobacteria bacterium]NIR83933.1 hopanoid biosynthesis-associated protein HpnK [Gammaproteobacteria bacterium]NIR88976.1 hopanoid biosynthesis-associated protein HpnK [Gammaproteobacteria bacterium]NIV74529.1 hopanoid biosynthesis-associated protein HpnK [Gammaproteobacteria bacterium]